MLAVEIKSLNNINNYECDIIIIPTMFSTNPMDFDYDNIDTSKKIALNLDKIIEENELEQLKDFLIKSLKWNIDYYIFSDMSVYNILSELGIKNKFIFDAKTLNCSVNDIKTYNSLGIMCLASTELTLKNVIDISKIENNAFLVYGYSNIFYSKRKLISLYEDYINHKIIPDKENCFIIEETRNEKYPIIENNVGTFIYTYYRYCLFNELNDLNKNNIFIINNILINEKELQEICKIYNHCLQFGFNDKYYDALKQINGNIDKGFLYLKPSILKGESNE